MADDDDDEKRRLVRVESRLVQLMLHLGLDPYVHRYAQDDPRNLSPETLVALRKGPTS